MALDADPGEGEGVVVSRRALMQGPSLLAPVPVLRWQLENRSGTAAALLEEPAVATGRLAERIPGLLDGPLPPGCAPGSIAACLLSLALWFHRRVGWKVGFAKAEVLRDKRHAQLLFEYRDDDLALWSADTALRLVAAASSGDARLPAMVETSVTDCVARSLLPTTRRLLWEADRREIPWWPMHSSLRSLVHVGQGVHGRRVSGNYTDRTAYLATRLASSKHAVTLLMREHGLPAPRGTLVYGPRQARAAARRLGWPVVVKPNGTDKGVGVTIGVDSDAALQKAFAEARAHGGVLVEEQLPGDDTRVTLFHGKVVAVGQNKSARLVGDGRSTVRALIDAENLHPVRGDFDYSLSRRLVVDDEIARTIAEQGHGLDTVPAEGERVLLRRWWRKHTDHRALDVTEITHPDNVEMFERAARLIGLDVMGIDFITPDITRPWHEVGGGINEVNPTPGFMAHLRAGDTRILGRMFEVHVPPGCSGRIPLSLVLGPRAVEVAARIEESLARAGHTVGVVAGGERRVGGRRQIVRGGPDHDAIGSMLRDTMVSAAVLAPDLDAVRRRGLGIDRVPVTVVTGITGGEEALLDLVISVTRDRLVVDTSDATTADLAARELSVPVERVTGSAAAARAAARALGVEEES